MKKVDSKILTSVDLFSGCGGLSLGAEMAGFKPILAVEADKWAAESFHTNFPETRIVCEDIQSIGQNEVKRLLKSPPNLICGGPPCQGFSHSNVVNRDPKDPRNSLFKNYIKWVDILHPQVCLIENVRGLLTATTSEKESVIDLIKDEFKQLGYSCIAKLLNAQHYGVPQKRERVFILAVCGSLDLTPLNFLPDQTHTTSNTLITDLFSGEHLPSVTLWDAISDLPQMVWQDFCDQKSYSSEPVNEFQKLMRNGANGQIYNHEPMKHTNRIVERFKRIDYGQSEENVSEDHAPVKRGDSSIISKKRYGQNSRRQRPDKPCNTIAASSHTNYIHPFLHRNFTVRETMRIQSFPDSFVVKGKRAVLSRKLCEKKGLTDEMHLDQRMQIGNAVPPLLAKAIFQKIKLMLLKQKGICI